MVKQPQHVRFRYGQLSAFASMPSESHLLCATPGFLGDWLHHPEIQDGVVSALGDLLERMAAGSSWSRAYETVETPNKARGIFLEIEVGGAPRLILKVSESPPVLFAMGKHEVTKTFQRRLGENEVQRRVPPPERIRGLIASRFPAGVDLPSAVDRPPRPVGRWQPEESVAEQWMYFLDEQQATIRDAILDDLERRLCGDGWKGAVHVVCGGPGTGKTSILLEVLDTAVRFDEITVHMEASEALRDQIEARARISLPAGHGNDPWPPQADVLLIDDPSGLWVLEDYVSLGRKKGLSGKRPLVVIGVDPLQMEETSSRSGSRRTKPEDGVTDAAFRAAVGRATLHTLASCYRQKAEVGSVSYEAARSILEQSSAFAAAHKIELYRDLRKELAQISNSVEFTNGGGWAGTWKSSTFRNWSAYIDYVRDQIAADGGSQVGPGDADLLVVASWPLPNGWGRALKGVPHRLVEYPYEDEIKGLEFNHVAIIAEDWEIEALEGAKVGIGPASFDQEIRPLRIALTRARDSLAIFGVATKGGG